MTWSGGVERIEALDRLARPLIRVVSPAVRPQAVRNLLSGTYVGHPLHPMLTDVPIGAWGMSAVLDAVGGPVAGPAADLLVKVGVVVAVPTAASGLNDWSDTTGRETRAGLVHAMAMTTALSLYAASAAARARGRRRAGKALGLAGLGALLAGGYLGGHLSFVHGVNVNRTAWQDGPQDWTPVLADADLADGEHRKVDAAGVPVLLYRAAGQAERPGEHLQPHGRPAGRGHGRRRLRYLPVARQHLPVRRWQHRPRPGQHARASLRGADPGRSDRGPCLAMMPASCQPAGR